MFLTKLQKGGSVFTGLIFLGIVDNGSAQTWLIDFGATNSYNGASQVGADANGNHWNSVVPSWYVGSLKTATGASSSTAYASPSGVGTDSYNGPLGANVSNPLSSDQVDAVLIDSAALGILGGSKAAAADYMSSSGANRNFQIKWLNPSLSYDASFYGAHKFPLGGEDTVVRAYADGSYATQVASASMNVGGSGNYNSNTTVSLTNLRPTSTDAAGRQLSFQFGTASGTNSGYLNAMALYGYLGYRDGSTTTLSSGSAYVANGNYANGDSRSVDTVVGGGTVLNVNHASGLYYNSTLVITNGGGTINADTNFSVYALRGSGNLAVGGGSQMSITHEGDYSGTLTLSNGNLNLAATNALGTGDLILEGGTLELNHPAALGSGSMNLRGGAELRISSNANLTNTGNNALVLHGTNQFTGGTLDLGTGAVTLVGTSRLNTTTGNLILGGNLTGSSDFAKDGIGTLTLSGSNSATSFIVLDYGTLALANADALANANLYLYGTTADKKTTFALAGNNNYNIGELSGTSTGVLDVGANTVTLGGSGRSGSFAGQITGSGGNLTKAGAGTVTLTGTSDYSGQTTVSGGKLVVDGTLTQSSVSVQNGGTLGGSGTVSALTIASGGTLAAGNSPGELTVTGNVIWSGGGSYDWEINSFPGVAGTNWDFLDIGGSLTIDATAGNRFIIDVISLLANNNPGAASGFDAFTNYSFAIATAAGGINDFDSSYFNILVGSFANSMNPAGATSAGSWGVTKSGNNTLLLNYTAATLASAGATAIPEPSSGSLLLAGGFLLGLRRLFLKRGEI